MINIIRDVYLDDPISLNELKKYVMRFIGGQQRVVSNAIHVMIETGLVTDIGNMRFKINAKQAIQKGEKEGIQD